MDFLRIEDMTAHQLADEYECLKRSKVRLVKNWNKLKGDAKARAQRTLLNLRSQMDRIEILQLERQP